MEKQPVGVKAVFDRALEIDPADERKAYLDEACANAPELRQQVDALLKAYEDAGSFLQKPAPDLGATVDSQPGDEAASGTKSAASSVANDGPGRVIGPYKLLQQIGEGGMGTVFMAEQKHPVQRMVALKIIKAGMDSHQVIARFEAERQALALMDHPNIAKVLDAGTTDGGRPYFVMELVKGVPITKYCDENHLTPKQRLELFLPVCQAVQHAHQKGIIHRDIKPSNVMVCLYDSKPVPKVIDFGVAKATGQKLTDRTLFTEFGAVVGTLEYMSPEQAGLNQIDIDTRSDIYSLGVLLYELLTGTTPLERKRLKEAVLLELLRLIREEEPQRPSTRLSTTEGLPSIAANRGLEPKKLSGLVRGELDWIVMKALEKDRSRRYETANGLAADVQRYLADEPVQACPPSAWYRLSKFSRRNRGPVLAATLVLIALLLGTVVASWQAMEAREAANSEARQREVAEGETKAADAARKIAVDEKTAANAARKTAEEQRDRANWLAYAGKLALAQLEFQNNNAAHALALLEECQGNLRHWEHRHLWTRFNSKLTCWHGAWVSGVCFSPDGKRLATASIDGTVKVWNAQTGQEVRTLKGHTRRANGVCFSPDGKHLASTSVGINTEDKRGDVKLWDAETGQEVFTLRGHIRACFSPDAKHLASISLDGMVQIWDARTGQEVRTLKGHTGGTVGFSFSPDSKHLASVSLDSTLRIWNAQTGQEIRTLKLDAAPLIFVCFSPNGKLLASIGLDGMVKIWDADTGQKDLTLKGHTGRAVTICFSPDGKRLASASVDSTVRVWDAQSGHEVLTVKEQTSFVYGVCFSPDGKRLASGGDDGKAKVWDAERGQEILVLKGHGAAVTSVCFGPDSNRLASCGTDAKVHVWDVTKGLEVLTFKDFSRTVCFSADGKRLAAGDDQTIKVWDTRTGLKVRTLKGHTAPVLSVCFSPDGKRLASASGNPDQPHEPGEVKVWDPEEGQEILTLPGHNSVCFSPDNKRLASEGDKGNVKIWDARTGQEILTLKGHNGPIPSVCFSPDGKRLDTSSWDRTVKVWDAETGQEILTLKGHTLIVYSVCFSPDGKRIASAGGGLNHADKRAELKLWEAETGLEVLDLKGHTGGIVSVRFSPDGKRLASSSWDGTVRVWEAEKGQAQAEELLGLKKTPR